MKTTKQYLDDYRRNPDRHVLTTIQQILDDLECKNVNVVSDQLAVICSDLHQVRVELANIKQQLFQSVQMPQSVNPFPYSHPITCATPGVSSYHQNWPHSQEKTYAIAYSIEEHQTAVDKFFADNKNPSK